MFTPYKNLPNNAKVWIYQSNRAFTATEIAIISEKSEVFVNQWTHHGDSLKGSFTIKYNQFLVLAIDESFNEISGCSIDASIHFIKELEQEMEVELLNKMNISFKDGDNINIVSLAAFQQFAKAKKITKDTIVFNNMVASKEAFETQWEVPANQSWHQRFLV